MCTCIVPIVFSRLLFKSPPDLQQFNKIWVFNHILSIIF